jgi:hypothetical protein
MLISAYADAAYRLMPMLPFSPMIFRADTLAAAIAAAADCHAAIAFADAYYCRCRRLPTRFCRCARAPRALMIFRWLILRFRAGFFGARCRRRRLPLSCHSLLCAAAATDYAAAFRYWLSTRFTIRRFREPGAAFAAPLYAAR